MGLAPLFFAIDHYRTQVRFLGAAQRTLGKVISQSRHSGSGLRGHTATWYSFRLSFQTAAGQVVEGDAMQTSSSPRFGEGQEVPVLYNPIRPQDFNIDDFAMLWADVVVLATVAGTLMGAGLSAFWISGGQPKRQGRSEARLSEVTRAWREGRLTRNSEFQPLLIAFAFAGFPVLGGTLLFVLFAPRVVQLIVAAILAWTAFQVVRRKRRNS